MNKGVILTAHDNPRVSYTNFAYIATLLVKRHLGDIPVILVTDEDSVKNLNNTGIFQDVIFLNDYKYENRRRIKGESMPFRNKSRLEVFHQSPFYETLLIDADYFIFNNWLNSIWGNSSDLLVNHKIHYINNQPLRTEDKYVASNSLMLYWATVMYFKKTKRTHILFKLMKYIEENFLYYSAVYGYQSAVYRNDFALSIAMHMMEGYEFCDISFPVPELTFTKFDDDIIAIEEDKLTFITRDQAHHKHMLVDIQDMNVHLLNKIDLHKHIDQFKEMYE